MQKKAKLLDLKFPDELILNKSQNIDYKVTLPRFIPLENSQNSLFSIQNINTQLIIKKSQKLLQKYNFPSNFINYCSIILRIKNFEIYIFIKFPIESSRNKGYTQYFPENNFFSIANALKSNEILHNGDLDFQGRMIKYPGFNDTENKVRFKSNPGSGISLAVLLRENSYSSNGNKRITERRGNKEIYGLTKCIHIVAAFIASPSNLIDKDIEIKSNESVFSYGVLNISKMCPKMQACYNYLQSQNFDLKYFDSNGNRCYCSNCFPSSWINSQVIAGETYIIPRGWTRFGLKSPIILSQQNDIWNSWCNVFHGTNPMAAKSIIEHKTLLINKDITLEGGKLGKNCSAKEWNNYYVSPHICYASHPWYSRIIDIGKINGKNKFAQIVLACKIRPKIYSKQQETEGGAKKIFDDYSIIPENEIEWYSNRRGCIVPYGVLVRVFGNTKKKEVERLA